MTSAGSSFNERMVRWERVNNSVLLKSISFAAVADESLPISDQRTQNNYSPILASFPIAAFGATAPATSSTSRIFSPATRRRYPGSLTRPAPHVRRASIRSGAQLRQRRAIVSDQRRGPACADVRRRRTAGRPRRRITIWLEMRQSMILLPKEPMRPRVVRPASRILLGRARQLRPRRAEGRDGNVHHALAPRAQGSGGVRARRARRTDQADRLLHRSRDADQVAAVREGRRRSSGRRCSRKPDSRTPFSRRIRRRKPRIPTGIRTTRAYSMVRWAASLVRNADRTEHAGSAQRRDHQQRDHLVSQPHALVSQPAA